MNGTIGVGYRLFNEVFYGMSIVMSKSKRVVSPINDYSCISNKSSEFLYKPIEKAEALAIRRENFNTLLNDPMASKLRPYIARNYKYTIQEPMHMHRDEMASKFESRIDYIDISAYGVGKVNVDEKIKKKLTLKTMISSNVSDDSLSDIDETCLESRVL